MKSIVNIVMLALAVTFSACSTPYRMVTQVHKDGKVECTVYALADSAFLAGDISHNPFLFQIGSDWQLTKLDSNIKFNSFGEQRELNVKVSRTLKSSDDMSFFIPKEEWMRPLVAPREKLERHFRWFYTYYNYTCDYSEITDKGPIPMDKYLNKQEQKVLFQGDMEVFRALNGLELKDELDDLSMRFQQWLFHSQFEISYDIVKHTLLEMSDTVQLAQMEKDREVIFTHKIITQNADWSPEYVCQQLDKHFGTTFFAELYTAKKKNMNELFEQKCRVVDLFDNQIKFELIMPGSLLYTNTSLVESDTLIWKVNAYRLLTGTYSLKAESRTTNIWAFCVTGILLVLIVYILYRRLNLFMRKT